MSSGQSSQPALEGGAKKPISTTLVATYSPYVQAAAQAIGVLVASIYILGYIVVNAYLANFGAQSRGPVSLTYIPAGTTLVLLMAFFAFSVGFRVVTINAQGKAIFDQKPTWAPPLLWFGVSMAGVFAGLGFGICVASAITFTLFFRQTNHWITGAMGLYFAIDFPLAAIGVYRRYPVAGNLFSFSLFVTAVMIASKRAHSEDFRVIFWYFLGLGVGFLFMLEFARTLKVPRPYQAFSFALLGLLIALWYGEGLYGRVPQALGGGKPIPVQLLVSSQNEPVLRNVVSVTNSLTQEVQLLSDDSDELLVIVPTKEGSRSTRLSKRVIDGIVPTATISENSAAKGTSHP